LGFAGDVVVYTDRDLSASNPRVKRPDFERLIVDMTSGHVGQVWTWKSDRLVRQPGDFERVIEAANKGNVEVHSVVDHISLRTPHERAMARIGVIFNGLESDNISIRRAAKGREIAEAGGYNGGGRRLFGYTADRSALVPDEARLARDAVDAIISGTSLSSIANLWNASRITTAAGNPWRTTSLRRYLRSPALAGLREYHGQVIGSAAWPAIITAEQHRLLLIAIQRPERRGPGRRYPLSGLLRCGRCGMPMTGAPIDGHPGYRCQRIPGREGCGRVSAKAAPVEQLVRAIVLEAVASDEHAQALAALAGQQDGAGGIIARLAERERWLEQSAADFWTIPRTAPERTGYERAQKSIRSEIQTLTRQLQREQSRSVLASLPTRADAFTEAMDRADAGRQGEILGSLIERIEILPVLTWGNNQFDPRRIAITWRDLTEDGELETDEAA
jgi:DNA invertase Pin-like site-specific DNA recombinase